MGHQGRLRGARWGGGRDSPAASPPRVVGAISVRIGSGGSTYARRALQGWLRALRESERSMAAVFGDLSA